jgi:hypothetical protein
MAKSEPKDSRTTPKETQETIREGQEEILRRTTYAWKEQKESLWNKIDTDSHNKTEIYLRIDIKRMRFRIELWYEKELLKCGTLLHFLDGDYTNYII